MKNVKLILLALTAALYSTTASSILVFDPTNFGQTTITAIYAANQEIREGMRVLQDIKNISNKLKSVDGILDIAGGVDDLKSFVKVASQLKGELEVAGKVADTFKSLYGASNTSTPAAFLDLIARREKAGDAGIKALMDKAKDIGVRIQKTAEQHKTMSESLVGVDGVTQAAMTTTSAVGIVVQQNQAMLSYYENSAMLQAAELAKKNAKEIDSDKMIGRYYLETQKLLKQ